MTYYVITEKNNIWTVWQISGDDGTFTYYKIFKTKKGVENWAEKQRTRVIWR